MDKELYQLKTAGYTMLEGVLTSSRVKELRGAMDSVLEKDDSIYGADLLREMGQRGALRNLCDEGSPFEKLLSDSPVYELIDPILGKDYTLHSYDGLILLPGEGRFPWDFHTDLTQFEGVAFPANKCPGINCLYYIDDATEQNGATWLVRSSHRSVSTGIPVAELSRNAFQAVGRAGDCLLFDARLRHCAGTNETGSPRRLIKALFCQSWIRPQMDYSRSVRAEVRGRLDKRTLDLLGVEAAPPTTVAELRNRLSRGKSQ